MGYLNDSPNIYGCYDSQCFDSTWDHDCPTVPHKPDLEVAQVGKELEYDNMQLVRMAIVEKGDRLFILMPSTASDDEVNNFVKAYEAYGWPENRVLVMKGPEAFAVIKGETDG